MADILSMAENNNITPFYETGHFAWIDIQGPTLEQLQQIAKEYHLHPTSVHDCLDSEHLPKYETINDVTFIILRVFDENCSADADTVQELTKKIAIFIGPEFIITIHRKEIPLLKRLMSKWRNIPTTSNLPGASAENGASPHQKILSDLFYESLGTFTNPIINLQNSKDDFETRIFSSVKHKKLLQEGYFIKRKAGAYKRLLKLMSDILFKISTKSQVSSPILQDLKETIDKLNYYCEDIVENVTILLSLYLSMESQKTNEASHRTNEIMRVLTVFSIFFMPLNFIAGIYGMNFDHIPELHYEYGYYFVLSLMSLITSILFIWIWKKGWLKNNDIKIK